MTDPVTIEQLRIRRLQEERARGLESANNHLQQILYNLRCLASINDRHNLQLDLPREDPVLALITQCVRIRQLDQEKTK